MVDELNFLESTGITILINNVPHRVKFQLVLIIGDNLGLNSICRVCKIHRLEMHSTVKEDPSLLRNQTNYELDVLVNNGTETGVKENCAFNSVNDFHVTENVTVDVMHDVFEGVCLYFLKDLLNVFIFTKNLFTLQTFNNFVKNFSYSVTESGNKPPKIIAHRLRDTGSMLNMSAAESLCLIRYLGLIIGHLVPEQYSNGLPNEHWAMYKLFRQIMDIATNPRIRRNDSLVLAKLIEDFHSLYLKLFGHLKPKFHFLLHYPRLLLENGPFAVYSTMRYESKRRDLKIAAQSTSSSKVLTLTIAAKQMYKMCETIHSLEWEIPIKFGSSSSPSDYLKSIFNENVECYERVEISGIVYDVGMFIVYNVLTSEKEFGKIDTVIKHNGRIHFQVELYEEDIFYDRYHAYLVFSKNVESIIEYEKIPVKIPCLDIVKNGELYLATRYSL